MHGGVTVSVCWYATGIILIHPERKQKEIEQKNESWRISFITFSHSYILQFILHVKTMWLIRLEKE